ncbi:MAG: argininosuccinate lyase [Vicinamibacterales bacterium]
MLYTPAMRFAPEYVRLVLNENFEDAKRLFLSPLISLHYAHLVMLRAQGIVSAADARALRDALDSICEDEVRAVSFDGACEDLFFYVERLLVERCGEDTAGRLHTARSRNDIDMTLYRMVQRRLVLDLLTSTLDLRRTLLKVATEQQDTIIPLHTHTQPAQPSTVSHYLLAVIEQLERDARRLVAAYETTNRCPLGACAITGTGFPIDRNLTSGLLGFSAPTRNTYGSIATVDYLLESLAAAAVTLANFGRFVQDVLLWCTAEFHYLRFGDGFVQGSSIMPQKRNPVAIEHARGIASKALGQATAVLLAVHNTPFGDIVDTEDDLQPLVYSTFRDAMRGIGLVAAAMETAVFDAARLEAHAASGWITVTELADTLVRDNGLAFRKAHAVAGRLVAAREADPAASASAVVAAATRELCGDAIHYTDEQISELLSPRHFVEVRRTYGGPAKAETLAALADSRNALADDERWRDEALARLAAAEAILRQRSAEL